MTRRRPLRLLMLAAALSLSASAAAEPRMPLPAAKARAVSALVDAFLVQTRAPGGTVAVTVGGHMVWARGFGLSDVEDGAPATVDGAYRTASIGKAMTATLAMMLAGEGRLDLDAPVQ